MREKPNSITMKIFAGAIFLLPFIAEVSSAGCSQYHGDQTACELNNCQSCFPSNSIYFFCLEPGANCCETQAEAAGFVGGQPWDYSTCPEEHNGADGETPILVNAPNRVYDPARHTLVDPDHDCFYCMGVCMTGVCCEPVGNPTDCSNLDKCFWNQDCNGGTGHCLAHGMQCSFTSCGEHNDQQECDDEDACYWDPDGGLGYIGSCLGCTDIFDQDTCEGLPGCMWDPSNPTGYSYCSPRPRGMEMDNDPHLKSWSGEWFDYMGECDLKLMHAPKFDGKKDLDIHIRTTIRYDYSFIEAAALRIGNNILEVGSYGSYALDGVENALTDDDTVPQIGGYKVHHTMVNKKKHIFDIVLDEKNDTNNVTIIAFKDWVSVKIIQGDAAHFGAVSGLAGTYDGKMLARNGINLHDDINALGQDWQLLPEEGNFFRSIRAPQYPEKCRLPASKEEVSAARRLGESLSKEAVEKACVHLTGSARSFCIHDVLASGDLDIAESGTF